MSKKAAIIVFAFLWLLGVYGLIWSYIGAAPQSKTYQVYMPENITRFDSFWASNKQPVSIVEFQNLSKTSPKILRVNFDGSSKVHLYYFGKAENSLLVSMAQQSIKCVTPELFLSFGGADILPGGQLRIKWERSRLFNLGLFIFLWAFVVWIVYATIFVKEKGKSVQKTRNCRCGP
jgi:hypothetical protein